jgi:hypothetical protein
LATLYLQRNIIYGTHGLMQQLPEQVDEDAPRDLTRASNGARENLAVDSTI